MFNIIEFLPLVNPRNFAVSTNFVIVMTSTFHFIRLHRNRSHKLSKKLLKKFFPRMAANLITSISISHNCSFGPVELLITLGFMKQLTYIYFKNLGSNN